MQKLIHRLFLIGMILVIITGIYGEYDKFMSLRGSKKVFRSLNRLDINMILGSKQDVNEIIDYSIAYWLEQLNESVLITGVNYELELIDINNKKEDTINDGVKLIAYYEEIEGLRYLVDLKMNQNFIDFQQAEITYVIPGRKLEKDSITISPNFKPFIDHRREITQKKRDTIQLLVSNLVYSFEEIESLESFSALCCVLGKIASFNAKSLVTDRAKLVKYLLEAEYLEKNPYLSYYYYFYQKHALWVYSYNIFKNFLIILKIIVLPIILFHLILHFFIREDLNQVLENKLYEYGISCGYFKVWRFKISNMHHFLFPIAKGKIEKKVNKFCLALKYRKDDHELKSDAKKVFSALTKELSKEMKLREIISDSDSRIPDYLSHEEFNSLRRLYDIVINFGKEWPLAKRRRNLARLISRINKSKWIQKNVLLGGDIEENEKNHGSVSYQKNTSRDNLIATIKSYMNEASLGHFDVEKSFSDYNVMTLEHIVVVMMVLSKIPKAIEKFYINHKELMQEGSLFLSAIDARDRFIIKEELGIIKKKIISEEESSDGKIDYSNFLQNKKVYIIGGLDNRSKQQKFEKALAEIGAKDPEFIRYNSRRHQDLVVSPENIYVLMGSVIAHKHSEAIGTGYNNMIHLYGIRNIKRIQEKVIEEVKQKQLL